MEKWFLKNVKGNIKNISNSLNISEIIAKILINRGHKNIDTVDKFINTDKFNLYSPSLMKDLNKGADIVQNSIKNDKKILIVGDYDVDGVISTFILYSALKRCGANVEYHIPHRVSEGYGINIDIINNAVKNKVQTIITCDNGISAMEQIKEAKKNNIEVVITDHHEVPFVEDENGKRETILPSADAIIDPKQEDCKYPFKYLCGAGVAFKFIQSLYCKMGMDENMSEEFIEYVAIATICDVVDLIDENRIIVKKGLEMLNDTSNLGLRALIKETGLESKKISTYHVGFIIGPNINATGRLETAELSLKLLLASTEEEAKKLAKNLYELNLERQDMTLTGVEEVTDFIEKSNIKQDKVYVIYNKNIHESIAGIIAGRIKDKYNVPTIILTKSCEGVKGSGRSIEGYNMFEELLKCKELLDKFGGHAMAAGLSLQEEKIEQLREKLNKLTTLTDEDTVYKLRIDLPLDFRHINLKLAKDIRTLEPFGVGNSKPIFATKNVDVVNVKLLGKNKNVLKIRMKKDNTMLDGIMFNRIEDFQKLIENEFGKNKWDEVINRYSYDIKLDFVYSVDINEYMNKEYIQLQIKSFRKSNT